MTQIPSEEKSLFQLTRELELLISAGLIFALLQLPGILDDWWVHTTVHVGGPAFGTVFIIYYVAKLVAYGLIAAIAAHFLLRGFWVAIMGLRSVFPDGVNREKLEQGEVFRKFYDERLLTLDEIEHRADRIAASIFAFVFLFLTIFVMLVLWAGLAGLVALLVMKLTGNDRLGMPVLMTVFGIFILLQSFVASVDMSTRKRTVSPGLQNAALKILKALYYPTFNFIYAPVFFTFTSHTSRRKMNVLLVGFLYAMIGVFMLSIFSARGIVGFDSYAYYPAQAREFQLRTIHYDNLREEDRPANEPSIQSDVVEGPYLRLFMPYDAQEDNKRMRAHCPEVRPVRGEGFFYASRDKLTAARVAELERCFDRVYQIALDGKPLAKPGFVFYRHPDGGVAGRLALVPVSSLAAGRHLLTVRHTPLPGVKKDEEADEYYIPFWR
ncbi:MAG TPA: hypothetical protein VEK11_25205 [Thermoanaerobaculia bacterium]|nr:hypothetical protein [Thermoanaerobaculia bacterium]